jgi:hypothetical protein
LGDCFGAGIVYHLSKKELENLPFSAADNSESPVTVKANGRDNKAYESTVM